MVNLSQELTNLSRIVQKNKTLSFYVKEYLNRNNLKDFSEKVLKCLADISERSLGPSILSRVRNFNEISSTYFFVDCSRFLRGKVKNYFC